MTDSRFTSTADDLESLLQLVDVDDVDDLETLLMFLFARPMAVGEAWDEESLGPAIHVVVRGDEASIESSFEFPLSVLPLARQCADLVAEVGPLTTTGLGDLDEAPDVSAMSELDLISDLQQALGQTRLFNMLGADA